MDHRLIEGLMEAIAPLIRDYVDKQLTPLRAELSEYKAREPLRGEPGKDADADAIKEAVLAQLDITSEINAAVNLLPPAPAGKDADPSVIAEMVAAEFAKVELPKDGKDADPDAVALLVAEQVEKAMAAVERPKDGKDSDPAVVAEMVLAQIEVPKDGKDADPVLIESLVSEKVSAAVNAIELPKGLTTEEIRPMVDEVVKSAVSQLPPAAPGKDADPAEVAALIAVDVAKLVPAGKDGKSVTVDDLKPVLEKMVDALPKQPTSMLIDAEGDLVAVYPDGQPKSIGRVRGEDGARGASIMDGEVDEDGQLLLRMSDGRQVRAGKVKGEPGRSGEDGAPGERGRDAHEIQIIAGIDETRSYAPGVCARWRGGIIRSERQTDPVIEGDVAAAGWSVYLEGIAEETESIVEDGREIERVTTYTSGKSFTRRHKTATILDKGVWKEGRFSKGDGVTWAGSFFIAQRDTTDKPETSDAWRLAVKRGRNGADGKIIPPRNGPVKI